MIEQLKTIREALRHGIKAINHLGGAREAMPLHDAMPALTQLEAMAGEQEFSLAFYKRRCDALQKWQSKMRDPERTVVCDILANGCTLEPPGNRYTAAPVAQQPQAEKPLAPLESASSYVQPVPDHCDRIVWRNRYYHLPLKQPQAEAVPPDVVRDAERYRWLRNESWAGYNTGKGTPSVYTVDGAGNRRMMLAEEAMDDAIDAAIAQQKGN